MGRQFRGYAALGDSFTEGMNDPGTGGAFRGWADRLAEHLSKDTPDLTYANLAVRGRLFDAIVDDQVPAALRLRPDLVSFAGGANDALRPGFNPHRIGTRLHEVVRVLCASGAKVILFTSPSPSPRLPGAGLLRSRLDGLNRIVMRVAKRHSAYLVRLDEDAAFNDDRLWSNDRLHLSPDGHAKVATNVCTALDIEPDPAWLIPLPPESRTAWSARRREDLRWARGHLAPWVKRRITKTSSGDTVSAKRPTLAPLREPETP